MSETIATQEAGALGGASDITLNGQVQARRDKHSVYISSSAAPSLRLILSPREWEEFLAGVKAGDFDDLAES